MVLHSGHRWLISLLFKPSVFSVQLSHVLNLALFLLLEEPPQALLELETDLRRRPRSCLVTTSC